MVIFLLQRVRLEQASDGSTLVLGPAEPGDEAVRQNDHVDHDGDGDHHHYDHDDHDDGEAVCAWISNLHKNWIWKTLPLFGLGRERERERELAQFKSNNAKR